MDESTEYIPYLRPPPASSPSSRSHAKHTGRTREGTSLERGSGHGRAGAAVATARSHNWLGAPIWAPSASFFPPLLGACGIECHFLASWTRACSLALAAGGGAGDAPPPSPRGRAGGGVFAQASTFSARKALTCPDLAGPRAYQRVHACT